MAWATEKVVNRVNRQHESMVVETAEVIENARCAPPVSPVVGERPPLSAVLVHALVCATLLGPGRQNALMLNARA
jgi:hypothetical protein